MFAKCLIKSLLQVKFTSAEDPRTLHDFLKILIKYKSNLSYILQWKIMLKKRGNFMSLVGIE